MILFRFIRMLLLSFFCPRNVTWCDIMRKGHELEAPLSRATEEGFRFSPSPSNPTCRFLAPPRVDACGCRGLRARVLPAGAPSPTAAAACPAARPDSSAAAAALSPAAGGGVDPATWSVPASRAEKDFSPGAAIAVAGDSAAAGGSVAGVQQSAGT